MRVVFVQRVLPNCKHNSTVTVIVEKLRKAFPENEYYLQVISDKQQFTLTPATEVYSQE